MSELKDIIKFNKNTKFSFYCIVGILALSILILIPYINIFLKYIFELAIIILISIALYNLITNTYKLYDKYPDIYVSKNSTKVLSNIIMSSSVIIVLILLLSYISYIFVN